MISNRQPHPLTRRQLRHFGMVMSLALAGISGFWTWRKAVTPWPLIALAGLFMIAAWLAPQSLRVVHKIWLAIGERLGLIATKLILMLTFALILTPVAFLRRRFGSDSLGLKFKDEKPSYWLPVEPAGPATRPDKPY